MAEITHIKVEQERQRPQHIRVTRRGEAVIAAAAVGLALGGGFALHEASKPSAEQKQIHRIIEDPKNIPEGEDMTLPASDGIGAIALSQEYGSDGHIIDLQLELEHEYPEGLPAGQVKVFKGFVQEPFVQRYEDEVSGR